MKDKKFKRFRREKVLLKLFGEGEVSIGDIDFDGRISVSPDGLARVIWETTGNANRVILLVDDMLIWQREIENPTFAAVSNRGAITVNTEKTFYVIISQGDVLMSKMFDTKLKNCGFANDETFAWVTSQTEFVLYSTFNEKEIYRTDLLNNELI